MQTVCAHCYAYLPHRRQRTACILCTKCEHNWAAGKPPVQRNKLPDWQGNFGALFDRNSGAAQSQ